MSKKVSYIKMGNKYLIAKEDGTTQLLKSEEDFNKYVNKNKQKK